MKRIMSFLSALLLAVFISYAQHTDSIMNQSVYLFEKFEKSEVYFRDGTRYNETINYNLLTNQFYFIHKTSKEVQAVTNPQDIYMVKVNGRCFYQEKGYAVEIIPTNPPLFVQYKAHIRKEADKGAYGTTSETSSIRTYGGFGANGNRFDLTAEALIVGKRYQHYWLEKGGKRKPFKNFKQFMKIYPKQKMALEQFIKKNKLDIDNVEDVKMLCMYAESL